LMDVLYVTTRRRETRQNPTQSLIRQLLFFYVYSILPFDITTSNARTSKKKSAKLVAVHQ